MSKAIFVMEMPQRCELCPLLSAGRYCKGKEALNVVVDSYLDKKKPDWCPLKPMPEKDKKSYFPDEYSDGHKDGYNACIDKILNM